MSGQRLIVLKFGGSVLTDEHALRGAVHEIYRWRRDGYGVVAVVSALAGVTDSLFGTCARLSERPGPSAIAAIVSSGELQSAALLGLHLDRVGIPASVLSPSAVRMVAQGPPLDATPDKMCTRSVRRALERDGVVVVAGYVAEDAHGRAVVLGRGGSDLTALFLAHGLGADRCRLIKDVDGLYDRDPASPGPPARRFAVARWADALATDGSIVQHKAVRFAQQHGIEFELSGLNSRDVTEIGCGPTVMCESVRKSRRPRIALVGLGTVGAGVYQLLGQLDSLVELACVAVRDTSKPRGLDVPDALLTDDALQAARSDADLFIEVMGGVAEAGDVVETALRSGMHVVTANKSLIAARGRPLVKLARANGCLLRSSAAVGGSMPLLERLRGRTAGDVRSIRAILNGTTNFILDCIARGDTFAEAVRQAQERGFAEADPSRDLDGRDAADKLCLVSAAVGLTGLTPEVVYREPLSAGTIAARRKAVSDGGVVRHVATLRCDGHEPVAEVCLHTLDRDDILAGVQAEHNAAVIEAANGTAEVVRGRGAGRCPTAEAVVADVLEIARVTAAQSGDADDAGTGFIRERSCA